jgi:hypothetical protein
MTDTTTKPKKDYAQMTRDLRAHLRKHVPNLDNCRQAIETRYFGPTDTRGSRIKAKAQAGFLYMPYAHELGTEENHARAALALADKYGWLKDGDTLRCGGSADGRGNVYVIVRGNQ